MFPVFVIGDSRTGTMSLHNFFINNGMTSLHYYIQQANQTEPLHENIAQNSANLHAFLRESTIQCFGDYPTRFFYRELATWYPNASFILTTRSSTERWMASMKSFLGKFNITLNENELIASYENGNDSIREFFRANRLRFLEICIDDGNDVNTEKLGGFLNIANAASISRDNSSASIDTNVLSRTHQLYQLTAEDPISAVERSIAPGKSLLSEYGWVFLANDTNNFLKVAFGNNRWSTEDAEMAAATIHDRAAKLKEMGARYFKFIIPEKSIVYQEYLPRVFSTIALDPNRPALRLQQSCPELVAYLADYLTDAKSYGQVYFRGDTHTNWLGAWLVYCYIIRWLSKLGIVNYDELLAFNNLLPTIASYDGDLSVQISPELRKEFDSRLGFTTSTFGFELAIRLDIPDSARRARLVEVPAQFSEWFTTRETLAYERADKKGLKAVIFRDSTMDFCHDLLAQHFSRSVFIWHQGLVYEEVIREEQPDIVLHVMAERFVTQYTSFPPVASVT